MSAHAAASDAQGPVPVAAETSTKSEGARDQLEDVASATYAIVSYQTAHYGMTYGAASLSNHIWFSPGVEISAGLRLGFGNGLTDGYCYEGFGSIAVVPHFSTIVDSAGRTASWQPALGAEVGLTSADHYFSVAPADSGVRAGPSTRGVYAEIVAQPARFRLSSFNASVLGLGFGTTVANPGRHLRIQIDLIQVGLVL